MVTYDPTVIHEQAQRLYDRAQSIIIMYGVTFGLLGLVGGVGFGLSVLGDGVAVTAIFGAGFFGLLGVMVGRAKGFELHLQAQTALCQVQIEINGRGLATAAQQPQPR